ncbi:Oligopeptide transport ATP-binding protein OppF [Lentibacillus sp. JNUCC-1]|uniref:ABC transporter ATP-binding protein n=1 Tax=Lentibacillus sp. JNUCC-1 TaxID=2654513 RepID=UPI0012E858A0|nr:ABC transporter ATP-binding protein [Lentibacillus sp. JNUCC-1]MUV36794.1 Oligopeptide transport ATP-binding protein OppF [Lentibacillus sp. JNUCC-1]
MSEKLLEIDGLKTYFHSKKGVGRVVDGIDLTVYKGETLGIVGESGCGKSMTSLSIMQLIPEPGKIVNGSIKLNGDDLVKKTEKQMEKIRGNQISMIFQEPMTSLNPVISVGEQIAETIRAHQPVSRKEAKRKSVEMLQLVGIPSPEERAKQDPYQLSGGMRQRVVIAMALACNPELLIADEPTTALDVTIQSQIIKLMKQLQKNLNMAVLFITHDLGVVAESCDRVAVMYAGEIVEKSTTAELFNKPKHPYTRGLLDSLPKINEVQEELTPMKGNIPSPLTEHTGCKFAERCPMATEICFQLHPPLTDYHNGSYQVRCFHYHESDVRKDEIHAESTPAHS